MDLSTALSGLFNDTKLIVLLAFVAVDFILGVSAAFYKHTFKLSYLADVARTDLLGKLVPWAALYIASKFAPNAGPGFLDLGVAAGAVYAVVAAALAGSILSSLSEFGFNLPKVVATGEKA